MKWIGRWVLQCSTWFICGAVSVAQAHTGELKIVVSDAAGVIVGASVAVIGQGTRLRRELVTDEFGKIDCTNLPFGVYEIDTSANGLTPSRIFEDVDTSLPIQRDIRLSIAPVSSSVQVSAHSTLVDPFLPSSVMHIESQEIESRPTSLPGRSVQDLVNSQPGWLYEGNAVLHPRGSEYQTQFVIDGMPLKDNRSPSFGTEIEADDLTSLSIYTAGFPAEYGRKMGGVVELNTIGPSSEGVHGQIVLSGGSYATAGAFGEVEGRVGRNSLSVTASGSETDHYLNPVVVENFTNTATAGDFSGRYERELTSADRLSISLRHEFSRFLIPNELVQQSAGQIQRGDREESFGGMSLQHVFSSRSLMTLAGNVREDEGDLTSNASSTPIIAFQHNRSQEGYFKGSFATHQGHHEIKMGVESDSTFLNENFNYTITDAMQFDMGTPPSLSFLASRPELEEAVFIEDLIHYANWAVSAGIRYDHYQLLLNEGAFSPRLSLSRYFSSADLTLHGSYDRIFQTPSDENILISSSTPIQAIDSQFLHLPVKPSRGNYFEGGISKGLFSSVRIDVNIYRRNVRDFADDDQLLNTGVSYPIAFDHAAIYGAEGKLEVAHLGRVSGFASYSYMVGNVWYPVTGGLFLGDDAAAALTQISGHFPNSQDQRNTVRSQLRYQMTKRSWLAAGLSYDTGLPFQYGGDASDAEALYGEKVIDRLNFARGRIHPTVLVSATAGVDIYKTEHTAIHLQADGQNLTNVVDVIDFGGLFSGNAIGPARSYGLRLSAKF